MKFSKTGGYFACSLHLQRLGFSFKVTILCCGPQVLSIQLRSMSWAEQSLCQGLEKWNSESFAKKSLGVRAEISECSLAVKKTGTWIWDLREKLMVRRESIIREVQWWNRSWAGPGTQIWATSLDLPSFQLLLRFASGAVLQIHLNQICPSPKCQMKEVLPDSYARCWFVLAITLDYYWVWNLEEIATEQLGSSHLWLHNSVAIICLLVVIF